MLAFLQLAVTNTSPGYAGILLFQLLGSYLCWIADPVHEFYGPKSQPKLHCQQRKGTNFGSLVKYVVIVCLYFSQQALVSAQCFRQSLPFYNKQICVIICAKRGMCYKKFRYVGLATRFTDGLQLN